MARGPNVFIFRALIQTPGVEGQEVFLDGVLSDVYGAPVIGRMFQGGKKAGRGLAERVVCSDGMGGVVFEGECVRGDILVAGGCRYAHTSAELESIKTSEARGQPMTARISRGYEHRAMDQTRPF